MGSLFFFLRFHSSSCCRFPIKIHVILANISFITFTFRLLSLGSHPPAAFPHPPLLPPQPPPTPTPALSPHLKSEEPCRYSVISSLDAQGKVDLGGSQRTAWEITSTRVLRRGGGRFCFYPNKSWWRLTCGSCLCLASG